MATRGKMAMALILLTSCAACGNERGIPEEQETTQVTESDSPTPIATATTSGPSIAEPEGSEKTSASDEPNDVFLCDPQADGRHFFHLDPDDADTGIVGFRFTQAYRKAHPDETAPVSEMKRAVSGSGMRYTNDKMEFVAKGDSGMLTLADGKIVNCKIEK